LSIVAASVAGEPRRVDAFPPTCSNTWNMVDFNTRSGAISFQRGPAGTTVASGR